MTHLVLPLDDGSHLALTGLAGEEPLDGARTLNVVDFLRDAVLGGVSGNLSYDMLKALAVALRDRGFLLKRAKPSAEDVTRVITTSLDSAGHHAVQVTRLENLVDGSWSAEGIAGSRSFDVRADPEGQVMQIRFR